MTRTVKDSAIMLQVMAGPHPEAEYGTIEKPPPDFIAGLNRGVKGLRMAWSSDLGNAPIDPEVRKKTADAALVFQEMGATVQPAPIGIDMGILRRSYQTLNFVKAYLSYGDLLPEHEEALMPEVRDKIDQGRQFSGAEYALALTELSRFRNDIDKLFAEFEILITPTLAVPAFPCGQTPQLINGRELEEKYSFTPFTFLFNMAGNPAASIPCGFSAEGLPIGLHIVGRKFDEATVLQISAALEEARPWADKLPPVS
jgi:aspartyl-tRNA(Asn)/glutamyl-tRNA(Gln) amidotransferase subunit A